METAQDIWMKTEGTIGRFMELLKFADEDKQKELWKELRTQTRIEYISKEEAIKKIKDLQKLLITPTKHQQYINGINDFMIKLQEEICS